MSECRRNCGINNRKCCNRRWCDIDGGHGERGTGDDIGDIWQGPVGRHGAMAKVRGQANEDARCGIPARACLADRNVGTNILPPDVA